MSRVYEGIAGGCTLTVDADADTVRALLVGSEVVPCRMSSDGCTHTVDVHRLWTAVDGDGRGRLWRLAGAAARGDVSAAAVLAADMLADVVVRADDPCVALSAVRVMHG